MDWMPSCELPAIRITASETFETFLLLSAASEAAVLSLIDVSHQTFATRQMPKKPGREGLPFAKGDQNYH